MSDLSKSSDLASASARKGEPAGHDSRLRQLSELNLELEKTRSEADAARLEARAVELELQIRRLRRELGLAESDGETIPDGSTEPSLHSRADHEFNRHDESAADQSFTSWDDVRTVFNRAFNRADPESEPVAAKSKSRSPNRVAGSISTPPEATRPEARSPGLRVDVPHTTNSSAGTTSSAASAGSAASARIAEALDTEALAVEQADQPSNETADQRRKPRAFFLSAIAHGFLILLLAIFTLSSPPPSDQIAIAGSVAETDEIAIENLELESQQQPAAASQEQPAETQLEISEIGEISIADLISDAPPAPPAPLVDSTLRSDSLSASSMSLKSDSEATMKFCGLEGGGNHFVYLVDSSASMGEAFESARDELIRSINLLKPNQRFYVIFFDAEPDSMRLSSPDRDEPRSVFATPENKLALGRWAMKISMDRGRAPYDALPFALDLAPDVIFLLSDGEFPQRIEDLLKQANRVDNVFGDNDPISIIHTIGYHSREGESRMRRIAEQNGGQYRHVPKPK